MARLPTSSALLLVLIAAAGRSAAAQALVPPPSCAPPADPSILFGATTPQIGALPPPFESILCNGQDCPALCGVGPQVGALIASAPFSSCAGSMSPAEFPDIAPLFKDVIVGGLPVQSLQTTSGVGPLTSEGFGTINLYSYTDSYFRAPEETEPGVFVCPADAAASDVILVPTQFPALPEFASLPTNSVGDALVCVYGCTSLVAVACAEACPAGPAVDPVTVVGPPPAADVGFTFSPLSADELACEIAAADAGPFVTPTLEFPATVNGSPATPVCMTPGEQLGAFVAQASSQCCLDPPCQESVTLSATNEPVEKSFTVPFGMSPAVGSVNTITLSEDYTTLLTAPNVSSTFVLYQWTTTYFNCQNPDGSCPADPSADIGPAAILSPFSQVFDGICPQDPASGLFPVCVYACLEFNVIECVAPCDGSGDAEIGQIFGAAPSIVSGAFLLPPSPPPSPPPPPGVFLTPPTCAPSGDPSILFSATTPQTEPLPMPFESILCNGLECPLICGEGPQVGALIASQPFSSCGSTPSPAVFDSYAPLLKDVVVGGLTVQSLQTTTGSITLMAEGEGTIELYSYTDSYFRAPTETAPGVFECPADDSAADTILVPTQFPSLPQFSGLPTNSAGDALVCVYGCTSVVAVACAEACPSGPMVDSVTALDDPPEVSSTFVLSPLSNEELQCEVSAIVGPFVTPTLEFPATVNGSPAMPICETPGEQLGALVGVSAESQCCLDPPCQESISLQVTGVDIEKAFTVPFGMSPIVSSMNAVSFSGSFSTLLTQPDFKSSFALYQWTSTYFACQTPQGTCPPDSSAVVGPSAILSPFASIFEGVCIQDPASGLFQVCVYACLEFDVVECVVPCAGGVAEPGQIFSVDPQIDAGIFLIPPSPPPSPPPPPGVLLTPPTCAPAGDPSILLATTTPQVDLLPVPFESIACNGLECPAICGEGAQVGALIASEPYSTCGASASPASFDSIAPLFKDVIVGGLAVQSLQTIAGVDPIAGPEGEGTINLYAYTDTYFRAPVEAAPGEFECPEDAAAGHVILVATQFPSFPLFSALPSNAAGDTLVCIYGCNSVVAVACAQACPADADPVDPILLLPDPVVTGLEFEFSPLSTESLACSDIAAADAGPFVTPTLDFPATVNGAPAEPICGTPGEQLGALVGSSASSSCCAAPPCQETLSLVVSGVDIEKAFTVPFGMAPTVSSLNTVSFSGDFETILTEEDVQSTFNLYQWTSTFFNCQSFDGSCPPDPSADVAPVAILSPFASVFEGICPQDASTGLFPVCVYACLDFLVIECVEACPGSGGGGTAEPGQIFAADPSVDAGLFLLPPSPPPSPPPPPGVLVVPPSCAPAGDATIIAGVTTPQIAPLPPPFESILCNGLECPLVCGVGPQVGALIASEPYDNCGGSGSFPAMFSDEDIAPLLKDVTLSGDLAVQSLQTTAGIAGGFTAPGQGTINIYAYTDSYFRAPTQTTMPGVFECPPDAAAGDVILVATQFPALFDSLPTNDNGDSLVCIYGCNSLVAVACAEACPGGGPAVDPVVDLGDPSASAVDFNFSPLSSEELACDVDAAVGPFVTPTIEFPAKVNQNMPEPICMTEGEQLAALVTTSMDSECCLTPPCQELISLTADNVDVEKSFSLPFMPASTVSSINSVNFTGEFETIITQPNFVSSFSLYQWTSTYFNCPSPGGGACPPDPAASIGPLLINSPFGDVFDGICPQDPVSELYPVCVYACLTFDVIECVRPCAGGPAEPGQIFSVEPEAAGEFLTGTASTKSDPHFNGFQGQSFDFHGVAGEIYHLLSDHPVFLSPSATPLSINARFDQAFSAAADLDSDGLSTAYTALSGATWMTELGLQVGEHCVQVLSSGSAAGLAMHRTPFDIKYGAIVVDGQPVVRVGSYDMEGSVIEVSQRKSYSRLQLTSGHMAVTADIVPPPKKWHVEEAMVDKLTHININIERIQLRHGLGVIGRSALEANSVITTAAMEAREADFRIEELCKFPSVEQLAKLE